MSELTGTAGRTIDPHELVRVIVWLLIEKGIKNVFTGRELAEARPHAEALLSALGVVPVVGIDDEEDDR